MKTDVQKTLELLQQAGDKGIHSFDLNRLVGTTRSAARIQDLKNLGYDIEAFPETIGTSRGVRYFLTDSPKEQIIERKIIRYEIDKVRNVAIPVYA